MTDAELIDLYLANLKWCNRAQTTIDIRRTYLSKLGAELGPFSTIKPKALRKWLADPERDLEASSQAVLLTCFHGFYVWGIKNKRLKKDPTLLVDKPATLKGFPHPIADKDLEKALANADPIMRCWLSLGCYGGARCKEIAGVSREDIFDDETMRLFLAQTKGDKPRWVPLNAKLLDALNEWVMPPAGRLWDLSPAQMSKQVNGYLHEMDAKRDDGKPATAHCLRHWYGSTLYKLTRDIVLVKELLGHASVATTQIYAGADMSKSAEWVGML